MGFLLDLWDGILSFLKPIGEALGIPGSYDEEIIQGWCFFLGGIFCGGDDGGGGGSGDGSDGSGSGISGGENYDNVYNSYVNGYNGNPSDGGGGWSPYDPTNPDPCGGSLAVSSTGLKIQQAASGGSPCDPVPGGGGNEGAGFDGTSPTGNADDVDLSVPDVAPAESDYLYTCPANFAFSSTTSSNLWQEGELTDIYCNLGVIDANTGMLENVKVVQLPQVYFGVPYYTVEGVLIYTQNQAKQISADALNQAEYDMRKKYAANPNLTSAQLGNYWVGRMDYYMRNYTNNLARAGRTGSINPANKPPSKPYHPCV